MDEQDGGPLLLARFLPYRLSVLANRASSTLAGQYSQRFGLSIPQWRVIAVLANEPGISAVEVAERERFVHFDLIFADVMKARGGFDVIVGNP